MYEDQVQHIVQHGPCSCTWPACQWPGCPGLGSGSGPGFHTSGRVQAGAQMIHWELLQINLFHSLHCSVDLIYGNTCSHPFVFEPHSNALNICHLHPCFKPDLPALRNATPLFAKWWENESASTAENQQGAQPQSILLLTNTKHQMYLQQKRAIQSIPMPRCRPVTTHHTDLSLSLSLCLSLYLSLSFFWSGHVPSSLWSNVSKVTSILGHSVMSKVKVPLVSEWVIEWQGHL